MSETDRRLRLWSLVVEKAHGMPVSVEHVCHAVVSATGTDSAAVTLRLAATPRETMFASDPRAAAIEELALTLGEGPCLDAWSGSPALAPDLGTIESQTRWPAFAPAAVKAGIRAAFALPLQIGAIHLGSMNLYRERPGTLTREQLADALTLADAAQGLLLDFMRTLDDEEVRPMWARPPHPEVHQATGMVTVQLGVTASVAFARLRAYAFAHDRRLHDVARDVVGRKLRFSPEDDALPQNGRSPHNGTSPQNGDTSDEVEGNG